MIAEGETVDKLAGKMKQMAEEYDVPFFNRDAGNLIGSSVVFLIGTRIKSIGLKKCGMCGFEGCEEKNLHPGIPCVFNTGDLGIAIGSAAAFVWITGLTTELCIQSDRQPWNWDSLKLTCGSLTEYHCLQPQRILFLTGNNNLI
jgi:uncharacterized ferredoxin-like protein